MTQLTFTDAEQQIKRRKTRRERFLEQVEQLVPWAELEARIAPHFPRGENGRPPHPLSSLLRIHCLQLFYNLSDPAMEDALYEVSSMRRFAGLSSTDTPPDETTILRFRHRLEENQLGRALFETINRHLQAKGLLLREGTLVDASLIAAPPSTKNKARARDPEMHSSKKGKQWYFGMKLHIGVDDLTGTVHSATVTAGNVSDIAEADKLLHGEEQRVFGDAGYTGIGKREEHAGRGVRWHIAAKPGVRRHWAEEDPRCQIERRKASIRARVEHPFHTLKQLWGYRKVRYRGLEKNANRLLLMLGLNNLHRHREALLVG